jgi:hypothetical protein
VLVIVAAGILLAALIGALLHGRGSEAPQVAIPTPPGAAGKNFKPVADPYAYDPDRRDEFEKRAAAGNAHILFSRSPGGAVATAERVARFRPRVEAAAKQAGVDPNMFEALIFLESAGREDAMTPAGVEGAAGLTQIVAGTATTLLGMHVDLVKSGRYSRRIEREMRRLRFDRVQRLRAARARVDDRFDPAKALAGTVRYLRFAKEKLGGSEEKAFVSYHMGVGNLLGVLDAYGSRDLPYAQVYFDSSPLRHAEAHRKLAALGDDSSNYLWKLRAARDVMALWRVDPPKLEAMQAAQTAKNSAEEVLHPAAQTERFATPEALKTAWDDGRILPLPRDPVRSGFRVDARMGELSDRRSLYRGLRPEALALLLYLAAQTRAASGDDSTTLTVTSTVRDDAYQRRLVQRNRQATRNFSLHTTGWAFDVLRRYRSKAHALAFQFELDRLQALNLIAWVREPAAIHVTVSADAKALLPYLRVIGSGG